MFFSLYFLGVLISLGLIIGYFLVERTPNKKIYYLYLSFFSWVYIGMVLYSVFEDISSINEKLGNKDKNEKSK